MLLAKTPDHLRQLAANWDVIVVGAGLAGSECALQLAHRFQWRVGLIEMRPECKSPAHHTPYAAELVCSNSLGSMNPDSAPQALKWEAEQLGSFILAAAKRNSVPAGQALAVDRNLFSQDINELIEKTPLIQRVTYHVTSLDELPRPLVIATGPLTSDPLATSLRQYLGKEFLYFFDAIAPIVASDSIDMSKVFRQSRYQKGGDDYLNCPLTKEEYYRLVDEIARAEKVLPKDFDQIPFFEGCMPIETMVERGPDTLRFGPLKPVGLQPPGWSTAPYAVVQLRQDNLDGTAYNMVGFQTRMKYHEQIRIFRMIPGLEQAEFLKLGSLHRNLYLHSPSRLNPNLSSKKDPDIFFAGQIVGVEGYFESACMGLLCAHFVDAFLRQIPIPYPPRESFLGSLWHAIVSDYRSSQFHPININFGLLPPLLPSEVDQIKSKEKNPELRKKSLRSIQIKKAQVAFSSWINSLPYPKSKN
ncbi:MAG: methylenetetrahydrofolate--tRNA-(uracil(54)-C(5))-methyltransferase (FADH(2)-oxidizing) TrmFO [Bdellovibrionaceae bacterium]|nr:methylenetetrahydrofolate--tRNA-(uracil(54)-C(5))-methyltransferase (FADH(2)-oxidizing) TrmFO [Pseudobdellovibrionaceae bacterium]MDW8189517.1 methylenetetrahydrofolate--tRNA-(uracil(54)-C(5))-methyltransferase (FADH(2)-oxidizing) TrmFO [Pseudobdellovibrionaceae bacterium]